MGSPLDGLGLETSFFANCVDRKKQLLFSSVASGGWGVWAMCGWSGLVWSGVGRLAWCQIWSAGTHGVQNPRGHFFGHTLPKCVTVAKIVPPGTCVVQGEREGGGGGGGGCVVDEERGG